MLLLSGPAVEVPLQQVKDVYDTNVFSILRVAHCVLPHMASRQSGLIINIGSIVGEVCVSCRLLSFCTALMFLIRLYRRTPWAGIYGSSKAAVHALSDVLAMECRPFGVKVMLVSPGGVKSNIANSAAPRFELATDSLYAKYIDNIIGRMWASQSPKAIDTEVFSRKVVSNALRVSPPFYMTLGSSATIFGILKWLPVKWVHAYMWKTFATLKKT